MSGMSDIHTHSLTLTYTYTYTCAEMRALAMGQYGHNNQPCHHILYLFALLGDRPTMENKV
jgi:hypothetical protein